MAAKVLPSQRRPARKLSKRSETPTAPSSAPAEIHAKVVAASRAKTVKPSSLGWAITGTLARPLACLAPAEKAFGAGGVGCPRVAPPCVALFPAKATR